MRILATILLLLAAPGRGEVRPPAGTREEKGGTVSVALGFGTVSFPTTAVAKASDEKPVRGQKLACNRGTFSLRYDLAREGARVSARRVEVRVTNKADYFVGKTARLEEHERAHQRINEAAAARIEASLAGFSTPADSLRRAERALKARFREELHALETLHRDWDATHSFAEEREEPSPELP